MSARGIAPFSMMLAALAGTGGASASTWAWRYEGVELTSSAVAGDGTVIVGTSTPAADGSRDGWIGSIDGQGGIAWQRTLPGSTVVGVAAFDGGGAAACGKTPSGIDFVARFGPGGLLRWSRTFELGQASATVAGTETRRETSRSRSSTMPARSSPGACSTARAGRRGRASTSTPRATCSSPRVCNRRSGTRTSSASWSVSDPASCRAGG